MAGTLYIVPTPVGNLADMTPRAIEILNSVDIILAEDTRTSSPLLKHFGVNRPLASHHKFNEHDNCGHIVDRIINGENVALISDAGTPGISDPGFMLSRSCREAGITVITLPGATAFVPALINSGLPCDRFTFQGFLPLKKGRKTRLQEIAESSVTNIMYESPVRLVRTLKELCDACGENRPASVSREISKMFEETRCGNLKELLDYFSLNTPRGEFVIIVGALPTPHKKEHKNKYTDRQDSD
ncbi:MAG: 16S rRNA (cytidine(1402)-2'-O)-methyltransferase [Muribaculaceae bacterium]|nr:16S rRNA (cytidine(1402)-2'-O)-methyltransferase [Muribaculaceae bacterium]